MWHEQVKPNKGLRVVVIMNISRHSSSNTVTLITTDYRRLHQGRDYHEVMVVIVIIIIAVVVLSLGH